MHKGRAVVSSALIPLKRLRVTCSMRILSPRRLTLLAMPALVTNFLTGPRLVLARADKAEPAP